MKCRGCVPFLALVVMAYFFFLGMQFTHAAEKNKAIIGVILPLTGPLAEYGVAMQNGIKMAQSDNPENFENVEFIYHDSQYKPVVSINIFRKMASDDSIKFIINFGCPTSQALVPLIEQEKVPTALYCSSMLMTEDKDYSFAMTPPANEWSSILWKFLGKQNFEKTCVILTQNDYLESELNALMQVLRKSGALKNLEVVETVTPQDMDFRSAILKIATKKCAALGVYLLPGQVRTFFNQSKNLNSDFQVFGTDIFESREEILAANKGLEGAVFVNLAVPDAFKSRYLEKYKNDNQVTSACVAYDVVSRVAPLIGVDGNRQYIMNGIKRFKTSAGACGASEYVLSQTGEQFIRFPLTLKKIENDTIVQVQ